MKIREIIYIKTIADFGNLTKAAEHLHITHPSLSQCLKSIEKRLGVDLFIRHKRGMILTEHGENFVQDASLVLSAYESFMTKLEQYNEIKKPKLIGQYSEFGTHASGKETGYCDY